MVSNESRYVRAKIINSISKNPYLIFRENPLIEYFVDDERCDSILILDNSIKLIGSKIIDPNYEEYNGDGSCSSISFKNRECLSDDRPLIEAFSIPFEDEVERIIKNYMEMREIIINRLQTGGVELTERKLSQELAASLVSEGFRVTRWPIIAYDDATADLVHKPGDTKIKNLAYIEAVAYKDGISHIFSETIFLKEGEYSKDYIEFLKAKEFLRENFITGENSQYIYEHLKNLRHEKLYLTQPLYPFTSWVPMPGDNVTINFRTPTVFDLWINGENYTIRKKFIAISGYESAIIL